MKLIECSQSLTPPSNSLVAVGRGWTAYLPAGNLVDFGIEKKRIQNELSRIQKILTGLEKKMANPSFVSRAPESVVKATKEQVQNLSNQKGALETSLATITS